MSGYFSFGTNLDDLFEAYTGGAKAAPVGMIIIGNGLDLSDRYAPYAGGAKQRATGMVVMGTGQDLSDIFMAKGSAPPVLGFNGKSYGANAAAPTNQQGTTSARLNLNINADGTWQIGRSIAGSGGGNGTTIVESGTWLPSGQLVSQYEVAFTINAPGDLEVTNGAPSFVPVSPGRGCTVGASVPANSTQNITGTATVIVSLRRNGAVTSDSITYFSVSAVGWQ